MKHVVCLQKNLVGVWSTGTERQKIIFAQPACEYIILYRPQRQSWISTLRVVLSEMDKIGHFQAYIEMA